MSSLALHEALAAAVLAPVSKLELSGNAQFSYCRSLTKSDLDSLLNAKGVMEAVVARAWQGVQQLQQQRAATGKSLSAKFSAESKFKLSTGR